MKKLGDLIGLTVKQATGLEEGSEYIEIVFEEGTVITFYHQQDYCEYVRVQDVDGDSSDLIGGIVVDFREDTNREDTLPKEGTLNESYTWTFYNISTTKGSVNIRWLGESNGYYSESVSYNIE